MTNPKCATLGCHTPGAKVVAAPTWREPGWQVWLCARHAAERERKAAAKQ